MTTTSRHHKAWHLADRIGASASLLCAIHCAALPFVLALLPLVGLGFLAGHTFERIFVLCAVVLAGVAIVHGYRRHRRHLPLLLAGPGLALLVIGVCVDIDQAIVAHTIMVVIGGTLVASAHLVNLFVSRRMACGCGTMAPVRSASDCYHAGVAPVAMAGSEIGHSS